MTSGKLVSEGVVKMEIQIKRKATGKVENYTLTGNATPEQYEQIKKDIKENEDDRNA